MNFKFLQFLKFLKNLSLANSSILNLLLFLFFTFSNNKAQTAELFPDAAWLQDVHFPGTVYAGIPGPLMPSVQAHLEGVEYMFHLERDVENARPLIEAIHAQGKKYWVNLDGTILEGNIDTIMNENPNITDQYFGVLKSLEGNLVQIGGSYGRNINNHEWRDFLISCIKRAIDAGADGSQHDGAWVYNGSFNDEEVDGFTKYIQENGISTGDWNPGAMNFREYLLSIGKNDNNVFENDSDPQNVKDLIQHWYDFKAVNLANSWQMVKDSCSIYAASKGKEYTIALNAGSAIGTRFGHTYFVSDYAIGEFFSWGNLFPYNDILAARSKIFEAYGKRFICWSGPTLEDIAQGDPNAYIPPEYQKEAMMHQVSTLYASGGLPQLGYPADQLYPAYLLAQVNREILNSVSSAGEIGVVMSHAQTLDDNRGFEGLVAVLQDLNRSFKIILFKSNRLNIIDDLTLSDISNFKVIFLPEVFFLTDNQRSILLSYISNGGTVVAIRGNVEYSGWVDENGDPQTNSVWESLTNESESKVKIYGQGKFINIAHNILEDGYPISSFGFDYVRFKLSSDQNKAKIAEDIIDTVDFWIDRALPQIDVYAENMPSRMMVFKYQDTLSHHYVYHLLSDSVEIPSRKAIPVSPFTIELSVAHSSYSKTMTATLYTIDNPYGISLDNELAVNQQTGRVSVNVPQFSRWGFIDLKESQNQSSLKISNLLVNNSAKPYRLKSNSEIKATWNLDSGTPTKYQIEVWTNLKEIGDPVVNNLTSNTPQLSLSNINLNKANKVYSKTFAISSNTEYIIPAQELHDSTVYFIRLSAIAQDDTSQWLQQFFYRNARPAPPTEPKIFTSHQNLWYFWNGATHLAPTDTSSKLIYSFGKGCDNRGCYGGDFEMDTLKYGAVFYTDSLTGRKDSVPNNLHIIDTVWIARYAFNEGGEIADTINFLNKYENFGIFFQPLSNDYVDNSNLGTIFGFCLDRKNDPPNEFELISPLNNSYTQNQITFSWKNNSDPDPFNKDNRNISKVEIFFDSVSTFNSPGLKIYGKDRTGSEFEVDTINLNLPQNYFQVEGLLNYKKIFWKVKMWDFDRGVEEGGGKGILSKESSDIFILNIGATPEKPTAPILKGPKNGAISIKVNPILNWYAVANATNYRVQLAKDSLFTNIIVDDQALAVPSKSITELSHNKKYFWRVKTYNGGIESDWSEIWKFKTIVKIPDKLILEFPLNNSTLSSDSIKFVWHKTNTVVDKYWFEYSNDSLFSNSIIDSTLTDTTKELTNISSENKYWWKVKAKNEAGWGEFSNIFTFSVLITKIIDENFLPNNYELSQNYPNPFNPSTAINFALPKASHVELFIYNLLGEKVLQVVNEFMNPGNYERKINLQQLSSGIYVYKIQAGDFIQIKKMVFLK